MQTVFEVPEADIIQSRRRIHAHPELSYKEFETSNFVAEKLKSFSCIENRKEFSVERSVLHPTFPGIGTAREQGK
jgi:metal-dependent amidase/aminoacylase/carboxypeptidase family protein